MTGPAATPPVPFPITDYLVRNIGEGYLFNVVRPAGLTCQVCARAVTPGYTICRPCETHQARALVQGVLLATQVAPIVYAAWPEHQSGRLMLTYKSEHATDQQRARVTMLGLLAFQQHRRCLQGPAVAHRPITAWSSVPSTRGRHGVHPMSSLGAALGGMGAGIEVALTAGPGAATAGPREVVPHRWVADPLTAAGRHVLLVDDTWTSGAKAQSAAAALHAAGARGVTTLILARWMDLDFGNTRAFLNAHAIAAPYSPYLCPITGGMCPPWGAG